MKKTLFTVILMLLVSMVANVLLWKRSKEKDNSEEYRRETHIDTIPYRMPVPVDSFVVKYITEMLPVNPNKALPEDSVTVDTMITAIVSGNDSVAVTVPITQKVYEDSTYRAYVSGYHPALDSITIFQRNEIVYIRSPTKPKRWGIGIQAGYGITPKRVEPYIGIGISYNILSF